MPSISKSASLVYEHKMVDIQSTLFDVPKMRIDSSKSEMFNLADKKREKGNMLHDFLAKLKGINDWDMQYDNSFPFPSFELMNDIKEILENNEIREFFVDEELMFVEKDILCPDGSVYRPDRVIKKEGIVYIIDFKSGKRSEGHKIQLGHYGKILQDMGFNSPKGVLIYLSERDVVYV
jgi:hypothetical protein